MRLGLEGDNDHTRPAGLFGLGGFGAIAMGTNVCCDLDLVSFNERCFSVGNQRSRVRHGLKCIAIGGLNEGETTNDRTNDNKN